MRCSGFLIWRHKKTPGLPLWRNGSLLAVEVEHHATVGTVGIWSHEVVAGVLVGHDGPLDVIHRIQGDLVTLPEKGVGEILQGVEGSGQIFR